MDSVQVRVADSRITPVAERPVVQSKSEPYWLRLLMPSISDVVFVTLVCKLAFWSEQLLADADIGWHIRNGDHILTSHSVPQVDYFSYTMSGRPWYAWEWLYDVGIAGIHKLAGLNGVVLSSALIFALIFMLLFRLTLKSSGNLLVALALTLLAGMASSVHLLARPHLLTWLFTLVYFKQLYSYQSGERKRLLILPALMLMWVNLHGGFLAGIALIGLFLAANLWTQWTTSHGQLRAAAAGRVRHLVMVLLLSAAATMFTPYSYRLYGHLYHYLGNKFLMEHIAEFQSPDFHALPVKAFALLLIAAVAALAIQAKRATAVNVLLVIFSMWMGLYATRNIPLASILLALTLAPIIAASLRHASNDLDLALWLRNSAARLEGFSRRMGAMELRFNRHLLAAVAVMLVAVASVAGAKSHNKDLALHFDEKRVPVKAAEYMAANNIRTHFFASDSWSGYLIYRLYPNVQVMMDDRHDFYGEAYVRDYLKIANAGYGWREALDRTGVRWVVISPDTPLASTLKLTADWKAVYDDGRAIIFERKAQGA